MNSPLRLNSLQLSPFKGEIFAIFTFLRCFWVKRTKNYSCNGEFFDIFIFISVIGVFLSGILGVCCFDTNHPFSFGWFVDIFYPPSVYFLLYLPFWDFLGWKWTKIFLLTVNALKFWYLFKWFGLFYLEFCVSVLFWHNWPCFFCLIRWHFLPWRDWSRRFIDWSIKRALRVLQWLNLCQPFVSAEDLWSHNLWSAHSLGAELLRDSASNYYH